MVTWLPPSSSSLRAFEAAARLANFTKAARELNLSQSAISHSIHDLEQRLGVTLFAREGRSFSLTEAGKLYRPFVVEALERLRAGDRAVASPAIKSRVLTVSVSPSFAAKWLVPRLGAFSEEHPDLDLRISANPEHVRLEDGEIDLAVRHGNGKWPNLHCTRLCQETMFAVCNPSLAKRNAITRPRDLLRFDLIHHRDPGQWQGWLSAFDVEFDSKSLRGPTFNEMSLVIDAAVAGQGVAIVRSALVDLDLTERRLIRPLTQELPTEFAYWIVCSRRTSEAPNATRMREWMLREARRYTSNSPGKHPAI